MNPKQKWRLRFVFGCIVCGALILILALYSTQIINGKKYASRALAQYVKPAVTIFDRGSIFFSSKDNMPVTAATVAAGYLIYINPSIITSPEQTYQVLSQYIKIDHDDFIKRASKTGDHYEELAHRVDENVATSIQSLGIAGVGTARETWRSYPGGTLSSHVIGLIGENSSSSVEGRYGLEKRYQDILSRPNVESSINMFAHLFSDVNQNPNSPTTSNSSSTTTPAVVTGDIITTLEPTVGAYVKQILSGLSAEWHSDEIGAIIMDPQTGEIIAADSLPDFDSNNISDIKDISILSNPIVEHVYEMGSIMKPLTMSVGLDTGVIQPDSTYNDTGTMTLNGKKISNYDGKARGVIPMQQILSQSLNVGAATVALKAGAPAMYSYFSLFGFGKRSGVDVPNEASGLIGNLKSGKDIDVATAAYGQGIAVSPLQMIRGLAVLANGGYLVEPHFVKDIQNTDGSTQEVAPVKIGPVLKKKTVDDVTQMLINVVDVALRQGTIKRDHYTVAAKTGTAQIPDHVNGGYYPDRYLHSFFGYFPAYNPRFIIFLYQIYPHGAQYASETLTQPFDELASFLINYYNIPPDR